MGTAGGFPGGVSIEVDGVGVGVAEVYVGGSEHADPGVPVVVGVHELVQ